MEFKKMSNGYTLVIVVDKNRIFSIIDDCIRLCDEIKEDAEKDPDTDIRAMMVDCDLPTQRLYDDYDGSSEFGLEDLAKVRSSYEDAKKAVEDYIANDGEKMWKDISLKKNGTFKRNVKPQIFEHDYGDYWEDSYGWNTMVIRLEPNSDTELEMHVTDMVIHY